jgi:alpha-tubulin suppressor-like RCC1 family protein
MANLHNNLFPIWINSPDTTCVSSPIVHPELSNMKNAFVTKTEDAFENTLVMGFPKSFSPISEFNCGVGYLTTQSDASEFINYAISTDINTDTGRIIPTQVERFLMEGLNGFYNNGNGKYVMSTFLRNGKFVYLNENKWAIWYDDEQQEWVLTDALNFHPSKTDYNFKLRNGNSEPTAGLYEDEDKIQAGYGSGSIREQLVTNLPPLDYDGKVQKIASCKTHTLFLDDTGCAWGVGKNTFNQIGTTETEFETIPRKLSDSDVSDIIVSDNKTFLIKINGAAFAVGLNEFGELGVDSEVTDAVIRNINGYSYKNKFGQLDSFTKIAGGTGDDVVISLKSSKNFTYILKVETLDGIRRKALYACGKNTHGQLGIGHYYEDENYGVGMTLVLSDSINNNVLFDVGDSYAMYIRQGRLFGVGKSEMYQVGASPESNIFDEQPYLVNEFNGVNCKRVACGLNHTFALLEDNTLWATGDNTYGQCGIANTTSVLKGFRKVYDNVKDFSLGNNHSLVLSYSGKLFSAGSNRFGQCATELGFAELSATDSRHASNGFVRCQLNEKSITGAVSYINAEGDSSFFTVDDKIYGVGFNVNGNLGIGSTDNMSVTTELSPVG